MDIVHLASISDKLNEYIHKKIRSGPGSDPVRPRGPVLTAPEPGPSILGLVQPRAGLDTRTYRFGPVRTQVREGQDRTPDCLSQADKSDSPGVDFRCLSSNDLLAACKFSMRALDAFRFRPIAGGVRAMSVFREIITQVTVHSLIAEIPSLSLGQKFKCI